MRIRTVLLLLALGTVQTLQAQVAVVACPALPADSTLHWDSLTAGDLLLCRAVDPEGREAFALTLGSRVNFRPDGPRAESSQVANGTVQWRRSEIAGRPDSQAREAVVEIAPGRVVHLSIVADTLDVLQQRYDTIGKLNFDGGKIAGQ